MISDLGISLDRLQLFAEENKSSLEGMTTSEVVHLLKAFQGNEEKSYTDYLVDTLGDNADVQHATLYVAHASHGLFLDLISSLGHKYHSAVGQYFWIDLFALPPATLDAIHEDDGFFNELEAVLCGIGSMVVVIAPPFECSPLLSRAWCLYELLVAINRRLPISVAVTPNDRLRITAFLADPAGPSALCAAVDTASAEARRPADCDALRARILRAAGCFATADIAIADRLRSCLAAAAADDPPPRPGAETVSSLARMAPPRLQEPVTAAAAEAASAATASPSSEGEAARSGPAGARSPNGTLPGACSDSGPLRVTVSAAAAKAEAATRRRTGGAARRARFRAARCGLPPAPA